MVAYGAEEISDIVDHICIVVKDLEDAVEWYTKTLGWTVQGLSLYNGKPHVYHLVKGNLGIDLASYANQPRIREPGVSHIAFRVEDVFKTAEVLKERGVEGLHEPFHQSLSGRDIFTFKTPGGVELQLTRKIRRGSGEDSIVDTILGKEKQQ